MNEENGLISVAGQPFYTPAKTTNMSPQEQAFLIAGNLSAVFHSDGQREAVWTNSENVLLVGEQPVMNLDGVAEAGTLETRLRQILSSSEARAAAGETKVGKAAASKADGSAKGIDNTKAEEGQKQNSAKAETGTMTMRQKLEAYRTGKL